MSTLRWLIAPLVAFALVFAVACGGDDDDGAGSTASTGASTGSSESTDAPSGTGSAATDELDLISAADQLLTVDSFRFNMTMSFDLDLPEGEEDEMAAAFMAMLSNAQAEGSYVSPDRFYTSSQFAGMDFETIQTGEESWTNDGTGWAVAQPGSSMGMFGGASPADLPFEFLPAEVLDGADVSSESVNGEDTTRYSFDKESLLSLAESFSQDFGGGVDEMGEIDTLTLDMWTTEEGVPVKMAMHFAGESEGSSIGADIEFNITDLNDPSITVEPPM